MKRHIYDVANSRKIMYPSENIDAREKVMAQTCLVNQGRDRLTM